MKLPFAWISNAHEYDISRDFIRNFVEAEGTGEKNDIASTSWNAAVWFKCELRSGSLVSAKLRPLVRLLLSESSPFQKTSLGKKIILARREWCSNKRCNSNGRGWHPITLRRYYRSLGRKYKCIRSYAIANLRISTSTIAMVHTIDSPFRVVVRYSN